MRDTTDAETRANNSKEEIRQLIHAIESSAGALPTDNNDVATSSVPYADGTTCKITYDPLNFRPKYVDEYTGEVLDPSLVRAAIIDELDYFNGVVWQVAHIDEMKQHKDYVRTR